MRPAYVVPEGIAWVTGEGSGSGDNHPPSVYLTQVREALPIALEGTAAQIWEAARLVPEEDIAAEVALATGQSTDVVRDSVQSFLGQLISRGLLRATEPDPGGSGR